ncbi:hypothetical protein ACFXHA_45400 [Nocardia sp. NPDC059240]|uniref:hypothetical protein n=1 Tax=Nocardia sp. NPDC059240 TaxID=3346786 RepID=UPI0036BFBBAA
MFTLVMFLTGLGVGGCSVFALVSYTALAPASTALPEDAVPVQRILARLEREGVTTAGSPVAVAAGRRHVAGRPRPALTQPPAASSWANGRSSHV